MPDLKFTPDHEWIAVVGDGDDAVLRLGITAYAQEALGDIVFVTLPAVGTEVAAGAALGEVESTKSVSDIFSPVPGVVAAVNALLESNPETINADPYGDGWLFEVDLEEGADLDDLMDADAYAEEVGD